MVLWERRPAAMVQCVIDNRHVVANYYPFKEGHEL